MDKTWLVIRQELTSTIARRSYQLFAFGIPVLALLVVAGARFIQNRSGAPAPAAARASESGSQSVFNLQVEGFVDQSGLVRSLPKNVPVDRILIYPDEAQAKGALHRGEITAYYVIPPDFLASGKIDYVYPDTKSYLADGQSWIINWIWTASLLDQDLKLADRLWNLVWNVESTDLSASTRAGAADGEDCSRPSASCRSNDLVRYMPGIMVAFLFAALLFSSSLLLNSLGNEKQNRLLEVLLLSIRSRQLLAGKIIALGLAGTLQTVVWLATILLITRLAGNTLRLPPGFTFPLDILIFSLLLFLGGFALYAALLSGVGALIPNMKETGAAFYIVISPLMLGYLFGLFAPLLGESQSPLLVALSLIPFTAPVTMVMRLADNAVPFWQVLLALGLLYLSAFYTLRLAAALFQAQNLLSGQPFSFKRWMEAASNRSL